MSDISTESAGGDHAWVHENLGAYLVGGLTAEERQRLDAHVNACAECFDAFSEARDADRAAQRALASLVPENAGDFEQRIITHTRETTMNRWKHPMMRRAAYATAAAVALAATGVFANFAMHQTGRFNNPLSQQLASHAEIADPNYGNPIDWAKTKWEGGQKDRDANTKLAVPSSMIALSDGSPLRISSPVDAPAKTMAFRFVDTSIDTIISQMSERLGMTILKTQAIPTPVTIQVPTPVDQNQAVKLLGNVLQPIGLSLLATPMEGSTSGASAYRVVSFAEAKKASVPVFVGADPDKIPLSNNIITQVIPLKGIDAIRLRSDLLPMISADADVTANPGANSIIVTDTSAKIHRLAEIIQKLDNQKSMTLKVEYKQLASGNATNAAKEINQLFETSSIQKDNVNGARGGGGGAAAGGNGRVYADADARTNTVILNGPPDQVAAVMKGMEVAEEQKRQLGRWDIQTAPSSSNTSSSLATDMPRKWQDEASKVKDSSDHLIPLPVAGVVQAPLDSYSDPAIRDRATAANPMGRATYSDESQRNRELAELPSLKGVGTGYLPFEKLALADQGGKQGEQNSHFSEMYINTAGNVSLAGGAGNQGGGQNAAISPSRGLPASGRPGIASNATTEGTSSFGADLPDPKLSKLGTLGKKEEVAASSAVAYAIDKMDVKGEAAKPETKSKLITDSEKSDSTRRVGQEVMVQNVDGKLAAALRDLDPNEPRAATPVAAAAPRPAATQPVPQVVSQLKIIRNGTLEFEVRSFDDTYLTVARIVTDDGGFVSSTSSEKLANGHVRGVIVVRVPPERLERFLLELRALGELKAQQIAASDVTKQYTDTESELRGLRTMESRLLELIKNGKGEVKDLVEAEKQLGEHRIRIEKLEGELSYYNNLVSMATISISAYEKDIAKPTAASEQENVNLSVETEEVETRYQSARKILDDAKARIVESQLRNSDAEHVAAHIVADVPPDKADFVAGQLKLLGKVASFNRDRKQTATGGTGVPSVQVEQKDTRVTIDLFNLANLAPRETTIIRVAVPNVEAAYKSVLELVRAESPEPGAEKAGKAAGRVLTSNLTGQIPTQMGAEIRAEVRAENAETILNAIRKSGEVITSSLATNADNASTTAAKRGIQLALVNIASVPAKEVQTLNIAVRNVDKAYNDLLGVIRKELTAADAAANPLLPAAVGRVINSGINGQQPEQMTADVRAEIRSERMADVIASLQAGQGYEIMSNSLTEINDPVNFTRVKKALSVRFINVATLAPRETRSQRLVTTNVEDAYKKVQESLATLASQDNVRILNSNLNQNDARNVVAVLTFEARRSALPQVEKAFADAGIEFLSGNTVRSNDPNTLDSKVLFQVEELRAADTLSPRRTLTLGLEVENVDKAIDDLRTQIRKMLPGTAAGETLVHEVEFTVQHDKPGTGSAHIVLDVPMKDSYTLQSAINSLGAAEKYNQITKNSAVPDKAFTRERFDLTLSPRSSILPPDRGIGQTARAALSSASGALIYSLYLVLTGLLFILPFALVLWPISKLLKRRKAAI